MTPTFEQLCDASQLSSLDRRFAQRLGRLAGESDADVLLATALTSHETSAGHACLDLASFVAVEALASFDDVGAVPDGARLRAALSDSPLVARASEVASSVPGVDLDARPLVLDDAGRVYLRRYFLYQRDLAASIRERAQAGRLEIDSDRLRDGLDRFFGPPARGEAELGADGQTAFAFAAASPEASLDRQRLAAAVAVARRFCVISGGPGTGKTATAGKILALIVEQARAAGTEAPRIALVAPTGKAAATLGQAIASSVEDLACDGEVKAAVPRSAHTIHRCLAVRGGPIPRFRHDAQHPLPIDVVLVDEASMVDLSLMSHLLDAVPETARVILLGDENQLASVEAGAVLGDICASAAPEGYSGPFADDLEGWMGARVPRAPDASVDAVRDGIVRLTHSYRYDPARGIGALARAINAGDAESVLAILDADAHPDVRRFDFEASGEGVARLEREIVEGFGRFLAEAELPAMLEHFAGFRVLSPLRQGRGGVEALNREIETVLRRAGVIPVGASHYAGRPVLVRANDYGQALFNGDIGFVRPGGAGVAFPGGDGEPRIVAMPRMPEHETAFAMTIHKSQGSEFDRVAIVIPDAAAARASRQLLYTAVTRAREEVSLFASRDAIAQAVERETRRSSGLGDALRTPA